MAAFCGGKPLVVASKIKPQNGKYGAMTPAVENWWLGVFFLFLLF